MAYVMPDPLPWTTLAGPLAAAEDALARLDERLGQSPIRAGWISRTHFLDACASLWLQGELVHPRRSRPARRRDGSARAHPRTHAGPCRAPDAAPDRGGRARLGCERVRSRGLEPGPGRGGGQRFG